jgi:putative zinc finger protein
MLETRGDTVAENPSDFRATLAELVATDPEPADHPSPDRWLAYQRGELTVEEEAVLEEHLVRCRDCFDLAQAADAFARPEEAEIGAGAERGQELAATALWRLLRPRLFGEREIPARAPGPARWFRLPLAASLLVALLGMTVWNLEQRSVIEALRAPRPNALIVDFAAVERLAAPGEKTLTAGSGPWTLVFHSSAELPAYRLAIRDAATGRELSSHLLRPDDNLALTLALPEGLPPGRYRLELSGGSGGSAGKVIEQSFLRVLPAGRGG